jgi:hypothetical protein
MNEQGMRKHLYSLLISCRAFAAVRSWELLLLGGRGGSTKRHVGCIGIELEEQVRQWN